MQQVRQQSEAMFDKTRTSYTVIPITRPVLADLCQTIDKELEKTKQDRSSAIYEIVSRKQHVQTHDSKSFLAYDISDDIASIFLRLRTPHRRIMIKIAPSKNDSYAIVEGSDSDRKSTRLNSSHVKISYAVFCLKKKRKNAARTK